MIHLSQLAGPSFSSAATTAQVFAPTTPSTARSTVAEAVSCRFCFRAEASIDPACVETNRTHPTLKAADWQAGRAKAENWLALVGFIDIDPRDPADDPVRSDAL